MNMDVVCSKSGHVLCKSRLKGCMYITGIWFLVSRVVIIHYFVLLIETIISTDLDYYCI